MNSIRQIFKLNIKRKRKKKEKSVRKKENDEIPWTWSDDVPSPPR